MIKTIVVLFSSVLPCLVLGQYTYFNTYMPAPNPGTAGGFGGHLIVRDGTLWTLGLYNDQNNFQRTHYQFNMEGEFIDQVDYDLPNFGFFFMQYADAAELQPDGTVLSAMGYEDENNPLFPKVVSYNPDWTENWSFELHEYDNMEYAITPDYHFVQPMSDGSYVAAGNVGMDTLNQPGYTSGDFIITRFNPNGQMLWHKHYAFHTGAVLPFAPTASKTSCIFELPNGDLLVWGCWYSDWDPMVLRFDSSGNFIDEHHWGSTQYDDWLPWPLQVSDSTFLFSYSRGIEDDGGGGTLHNVRVGLFNANTMVVEWEQDLDHPHGYGQITDFEKLSNGTFVLLASGIQVLGPDAPFVTFLLAVDDTGTELWYHEYEPPIPYITTTPADLEITPEGGLAFVGNFFRADENQNPIDQVTWIVKTDACGDEVFNGCPTHVAELNQRTLNFNIYPNPSNTILNITSDREFESITVRNLVGQVVHQVQLNNHSLQSQIDLSSIAIGVYLVEVFFCQGVVAAQRLVVE